MPDAPHSLRSSVPTIHEDMPSWQSATVFCAPILHPQLRSNITGLGTEVTTLRNITTGLARNITLLEGDHNITKANVSKREWCWGAGMAACACMRSCAYQSAQHGMPKALQVLMGSYLLHCMPPHLLQ